MYLNLVLDFVPETVYRVARHFNKAKTTIPIIYVKVGTHTHTACSLAERANSTHTHRIFNNHFLRGTGSLRPLLLNPF